MGQVRGTPTQCSKAPVVVGVGVLVGVFVGVAGAVIQAGCHQHIGVDLQIALAQGRKCAE